MAEKQEYWSCLKRKGYLKMQGLSEGRVGLKKTDYFQVAPFCPAKAGGGMVPFLGRLCRPGLIRYPALIRLIKGLQTG